MNDPLVPNKDRTYRTGPLDMDQVGALETLLREGALVEIPKGCNCGQCGRMHTSGCAVHNEPAYPAGACNCRSLIERK